MQHDAALSTGCENVERLFRLYAFAGVANLVRRALLGTCTLLLSFAAAAEPVRVIDGDGLEFGGITYRLHGIDAPELDQTCEREDVTYACGKVAAEPLRAFVGDDPVSCDPVNQDRYGRTITRCSVDGVDLGSMTVNSGCALDWPRYKPGRVPGRAGCRTSRRAGASGAAPSSFRGNGAREF